MTDLTSFLGESLLSEKGKSTVETASLDQAPVIALYFSAHWCPPCKMFTPKLRQFYNEVNATSKKLEIVWISADEDEEEFNEYFEEMPWLSMPFEPTELREEVSEKFDIASIPQLIILNKDGSLKSATGKTDVEQKGASAFESWQ